MTRRVLALRTARILVPLMVAWPLDVSAQSSVDFVEPHHELRQPKLQVGPRDWLAAPSRLESDANILLCDGSNRWVGLTERLPLAFLACYLHCPSRILRSSLFNSP
jgi:hypothetical protein